MNRMITLLPLIAIGCGPQYLVTDNAFEGELSEDAGSDTGEVGDTGIEEEEEDFSEFDDASLVIVQPTSGEYLPWEQVNAYEAYVVDAEGNTMDFEDISWGSDVDEDWTPTGTWLEDDTLGVGTHALTASAELPNGDRLAYTIGGVLVQSAYAGTYVGTTVVELSISGYSAACSGALTAVIDQEGDVGWGDSNCYVSLQGFEVDLSFNYDLENDLGAVQGDASLDIYGYEVPVDLDGELSEDGALYGTFAYDLGDYLAVSGEVEATRISRETTTEE